MARKYKRLSYEDRKTIEEMCRNGKKADEIAAAMDVHRATIYHELQEEKEAAEQAAVEYAEENKREEPEKDDEPQAAGSV